MVECHQNKHNVPKVDSRFRTKMPRAQKTFKCLKNRGSKTNKMKPQADPKEGTIRTWSTQTTALVIIKT